MKWKGKIFPKYLFFEKYAFHGLDMHVADIFEKKYTAYVTYKRSIEHTSPLEALASAEIFFLFFTVSLTLI